MILRATPLAFALATMLGWTLFLAVLVDRAELFIVAVPLAASLLSLSRSDETAELAITQHISSDRLSEGDRLTVSVAVSASAPIPIAELLVVLDPLLHIETGSSHVVLAIEPGREANWSFQVRCPARGRFDLGTIHVRLWDRAGLSLVERSRAEAKPISVYPSIERVRHVPQPVRTQFSFGNYVSPALGEGIEPGEIRPFLPGDRTRHINWRASLRRQQLYVTQFHEERNADVVLLLDTLADIGARPFSTLDLEIRAAAALAYAYLARKDRVGFVEFGAFLRWIAPATGQRQGEALVEGLLPAATHFSYVTLRLDRLPPRILPPRALVIALTSLLDDRFTNAIVDLTARGFDVIVLALPPIDATRRILDHSIIDESACRVWAMEWQVKLARLRGRGLTIAEWPSGMPLESVLVPLSRTRPRSVAPR
jgi:uncharacterized protein (DUF58 family)